MRAAWVLLGSMLLAALLSTESPVRAQRTSTFQGSADHPAIAYSTGTVDNVVDSLDRRLANGTARLSFKGRSGYLRSTLEALGIPLDSQMLVHSPLSLQGRYVSPASPRALFFKDDVAVGWVRGGDLLELATFDARQGVVFYTLTQKEGEEPRFKRATICLGCHMARDTYGVPGLLMFSATQDMDRPYGKVVFTDYTTPIANRFGGWFVTGTAVPASHRGNAVPALEGRLSGPLSSTRGLYDPDGHLVSSSDVTALMVFAHQARMTNLLVRAGWEARMATPDPILVSIAADVVDGLLFIDEAKLTGRVQGNSGFAERFAAEGPRDRKGRSLRELDLAKRLMRYPCSYLVYSAAFDALPSSVRDLVYQRLWQILSGAEKDPRYRALLSLAERQAIVEILRDTKRGLPSYFKPVTS